MLASNAPTVCPAILPAIRYGGLPVVFAEEIAGGYGGIPVAVDPAAFSVTVQTRSGSIPAPVVCALLAPARGASENRTVALVGDFGRGVHRRGDVRSLTVEVVGDLFTERGMNLNPQALGQVVSFVVTAPFEAGPPLVYAERVRLPDATDEHACPDGADWVVRLVFAGGVSQMAGHGPACLDASHGGDDCYLDSFGCRLTDAEAQTYAQQGAPPGLRACVCDSARRDGCGVLRLRDQAGRRMWPFAIADLFDGDNNLEICLRDTDQPNGFVIPTTVRPASRRFSDPHRDRNRAQRPLSLLGADD